MYLSFYIVGVIVHMSGCFDAAVEKLGFLLREQESVSFKTPYEMIYELY